MFKTGKISYMTCYTIPEVCQIIHRSERTVRDFIKDGLKCIDSGTPKLIRGYDLIKFLKCKNNINRTNLEFSEFFCLKCKEAVFPKGKQITISGNGPIMVGAICAVCGTRINKPYKMTDLPELRRIFKIVEKLSISDSVSMPLDCNISESDNTPQTGNQIRMNL